MSSELQDLLNECKRDGGKSTGGRMSFSDCYQNFADFYRILERSQGPVPTKTFREYLINTQQCTDETRANWWTCWMLKHMKKTGLISYDTMTGKGNTKFAQLV